jgi:hypothetical protein
MPGTRLECGVAGWVGRVYISSSRSQLEMVMFAIVIEGFPLVEQVEDVDESRRASQSRLLYLSFHPRKHANHPGCSGTQTQGQATVDKWSRAMDSLARFRDGVKGQATMVPRRIWLVVMAAAGQTMGSSTR